MDEKKGRLKMKKQENKNVRRGMLVLLSLMMVGVMALVGGSVGGMNSVETTAYAEAAAVPAVDPSPAIYVAEKNINSVVGVIASEQTWDGRSVVNEPISQGSGVVIAQGGYVLTNYHVIEGATAYEVLMPSGEKVEAFLAGGDSATDLAVLKVEGDAARELVAVTIGSTEALKVGSTAIAIGNPGGEDLANTVTQGIVSALERTSVTSSNTSRRIEYIQHDAAINSGNSGGGLFNFRGELIGINTLKYSGSAYSSVSFEGLGFAIPVETVTDIAQQLIENGKVIRPGLGVTVSDVANGPDEPLSSTPPVSVCIRSINEGGAAEKAGLKQYDFIYAVNGERVRSMLDLTGILDLHEAGDVVSVTVIRYNEAGIYQTQSPSLFSYGFGYGYNPGSSSGQLIVGGGFQEITVDVTLEILEEN